MQYGRRIPEYLLLPSRLRTPEPLAAILQPVRSGLPDLLPERFRTRVAGLQAPGAQETAGDLDAAVRG